MHDMHRLDDELAEWATKVDLVLSSDSNTWFLPDLERSAARMRSLLVRLEWDEVQSVKEDVNIYLDHELERLKNISVDFSEDHQELIAEAVIASDAEFTVVLEQFHDAISEVTQLVLSQRLDVEKSRNYLRIVSWVAICLYLLFIAILWRWAAKTITRPIEQLANATRESLETGDSLAVISSGPREIQMLTQSVLSLTGSLESMVEERTADIRVMSELRKIVLDTVPFPLALIDGLGMFQQCNPAYLNFFGIPTPYDVIGLLVKDLPIGPLLELGDGEHDLIDGQGEPRKVQLISANVPGERGQILCLMDVTEQVEHAAHLQLLNRELDHRVKNMLSTIMALCSQVAERATTDTELFKDLTNRVMGFSNIHELLSKQGMSWIDLRKLIFTCVNPFQQEQAQSLQLSGPNVRVNPTATVKLVMVFNELATNASKHGALKYDEGLIEVSWRRSNGQLELTWRERHQGEVSSLLEGGFGTMVLKSSIPYEFDGLAELERTDDGIRFKASIPLEKIEAF